MTQTDYEVIAERWCLRSSDEVIILTQKGDYLPLMLMLLFFFVLLYSDCDYLKFNSKHLKFVSA